MKTSFKILLFSFLFGILSFSFAYTAEAEFSEDFASTKNIGSLTGINVSTASQMSSLPIFETTLSDSDTLLMSHMDSNSDIANPAIGVGGTGIGITYVAGQSGNGAQLTATPSPTLYFPKNGNIDAQKGSVSFWAKSSNWSGDVYLFSVGNSFYDLTANSNGITTRFFITIGGKILVVHNIVPSSTSAWHQFIFSWDAQAGVMSSSVDGNTSTVFFTAGAPAMSTLSGNFFLGYFAGKGNTQINVAFDELRITNKPYSPSFKYPNGYNLTGVLQSVAFDTGVTNPVWGNIVWQASGVGNGTPVYIQTDVSDNNSTWDGWLRKGMVSFTYDDGLKAPYLYAKPIFDQYGFKATVYVITDYIGMSSNYLSLNDLHTLENAGWEIGGHSTDHSALNTLTESQIRTKFGDGCAIYLRNQGFKISGMATPYGIHPNSFSEPILDDYYSYVRGGGGYKTVGSANSGYPNYGPMNLLWTYDGDLTLDKSMVDNAVANKQWVIFTDHFVNPNDSFLSAFVPYVASSGAEVVTVAEGMQKISYGTSAGSQITSANKRFIRYRAIMFSTAGSASPSLSEVIIREPAKIYKELINTINSNGVYTHNVWPQTTNTELSNLIITPSAGAVVVSVSDWNTTGTYSKKWTESATMPNITTSHIVGDLMSGKNYQVKIDGATAYNLMADSSGKISFAYPASDTATKTFEVSASSAVVVTHTLTYENTGEAQVDHLVITETIPAGTIYVDGSAVGDPTFIDNTLTWIIPFVPVGGSGSVSYKVRMQ